MRFKTFLSLPLQNNNVKLSKFTWSEKGNPDSRLFKFPFGAQRRSHTLG